MQARIGELLSQVSNLSIHDVEEILSEQRHSRQRFGEIALAHGLCAPQDVWQAWCTQVADRHEHVDLDDIGIDAQAVADISPELAWLHGIIPVRSFADELLIATSTDDSGALCAMLAGILGRNVRAVTASREQIEWALKEYYPPPTLR